MNWLIDNAEPVLAFKVEQLPAFRGSPLDNPCLNLIQAIQDGTSSWLG